MRRKSILRSLLLLLCGLCICARAQEGKTASLAIDAAKVENTISPTLYGQFAEFMFEDVKGGLYAELIRDRSFAEAPNVSGLTHYWARCTSERTIRGSQHWSPYG